MLISTVELAKLSGVSRQLIRYRETRGDIDPPERDYANRKRWGVHHVRQLAELYPDRAAKGGDQ